MKRFIVLASFLSVFVILSGCGNEADDLTRSQIKLMNDYADAIETNAPEARMKELQNRVEENGKKMEKLKLSDDEKKKLEERHKADFEKATARLQKAIMGKLGGLDQFKMPPMPSKKG